MRDLDGIDMHAGDLYFAVIMGDPKLWRNCDSEVTMYPVDSHSCTSVLCTAHPLRFPTTTTTDSSAAMLMYDNAQPRTPREAVPTVVSDIAFYWPETARV